MGSKHLVLGGWGVAPEAVRSRLAGVLPVADITALPPTRASLEAALASPKETTLVGWSLGAHLLLDAASAGKVPADRRIILVCPFFAFPSEVGEGGRIALTQVKFLRRRLTRDPHAALADFYQRAGLRLEAPAEPPYPTDDLLAGLDLLADPAPRHTPSSRPLPSSALLLAGASDPLVDHRRLLELLPALRVLPEAGHDIADFVHEIARHA